MSEQPEQAPWQRGLGESLLHYRKLTGMSQALVADIAEVSQGNLSRAENGWSGFCIPTLLRLSEVYGIKLSELLSHAGL